MENILAILKALSDLNRVRIMNLLNYQDLCVCEVEEILDISQSNASRHLNKLKGAKLINARKDAQWTYYSLNETTIASHPFIRVLLEDSLKNIEELRQDQNRLELHREKESKECTR